MASLLSSAVGLSSEWLEAWANGDLVFRKQLAAAGLDGPIIWAGLRGDRAKVRALLNALGLVDGADAEERLEFCVALQRAARPAGADWGVRSGFFIGLAGLDGRFATGAQEGGRQRSPVRLSGQGGQGTCQAGGVAWQGLPQSRTTGRRERQEAR